MKKISSMISTLSKSFNSLFLTKKITKNNIIGLWNLINFKIISLEGIAKNWAKESYGTLLYTRKGFVSVSINGKENGALKCLFYSGKYFIQNDHVIKHRVDNATDPERINKTMMRIAAFDNGILTLTAQGNYGTVIVKWQRTKSIK